jgi:molybdate transport system substrate-binding protein
VSFQKSQLQSAQRRRALLGIGFGAATGCLLRPGLAADATGPEGRVTAPLVAAASDLKFVLEEIAAGFRSATGHSLRLSFGASGHFARQIERGAPFEIFLSADETLVFRLADSGLTRDRGEVYAIGHLSLFVPHGSPLKADPGLSDLRASLHDGRLRHFAIANPGHAPYGAAARAVLQHTGLWAAIQSRLVIGENAAQAAQFAVSGHVQAGLLARSLIMAPSLAKAGVSADVDPAWHPALRQRMVLLRGAGPVAVAFRDWMLAASARSLLRRYGFGPSAA